MSRTQEHSSGLAFLWRVALSRDLTGELLVSATAGP
jgi:hypothetical protein